MGLGKVFVLAALGAGLLAALRAEPGSALHTPLADQARQAALDAWDLVRPGGAWHPQRFLEHHGHLATEAVLLLLISYLLVQSSSKPRSKKGDKPLSEAEKDALVAEWQPEPLVGSCPPHCPRAPPRAPVVVRRHEAPFVELEDGSRLLNFASSDFLGMSTVESIRDDCKQAIAKYGVGSCGPRGFYGTVDVHLSLEERVARLMGVPEAILYSFDGATLPSILPAFANARDLIVVDDAANYGVQSGCTLSRARVLRFKHNDMEDLERVLTEVAKEDRRKKKPLNRRFIAVEGVYANTGEVAPLAAIARLKDRFKYRLVVDESFGLGVLGDRARGAHELAGLDHSQVDIVGASLSHAAGSMGGFCTGEREMVDHQRLSGLGYCFSASSPPYTAVAASAALDHIMRTPEGALARARLAANARAFRARAAADLPLLRVVDDGADGAVPLVHLRLAAGRWSEEAAYSEGDLLLERVVDECRASHGLLLAAARYSWLERSRQPPSLRVCVTALHSAEQLDRLVRALGEACRRVLCE